jgi:hypothetical protein
MKKLSITLAIAALFTANVFASSASNNEPIKNKKTNVCQVNIAQPANEKLILNIENLPKSNFQILLMNESFQIVFNQFAKSDLENFTQKFDLKNLPAGNYSLVLYAGNQTIQKTFVVESTK